MISDSLTNDGPRNAGWIYLVIFVDAKLPNVDHVDDDVDINFGVDFVYSIPQALNAWVCCMMSINVFQYFGFYVEFAKLVLRLCTVFQNRAGERASQLDKTFC